MSRSLFSRPSILLPSSLPIAPPVLRMIASRVSCFLYRFRCSASDYDSRSMPGLATLEPVCTRRPASLTSVPTLRMSVVYWCARILFMCIVLVFAAITSVSAFFFLIFFFVFFFLFFLFETYWRFCCLPAYCSVFFSTYPRISTSIRWLWLASLLLRTILIDYILCSTLPGKLYLTVVCPRGECFARGSVLLCSDPSLGDSCSHGVSPSFTQGNHQLVG